MQSNLKETNAHVTVLTLFEIDNFYIWLSSH